VPSRDRRKPWRCSDGHRLFIRLPDLGSEGPTDAEIVRRLKVKAYDGASTPQPGIREVVDGAGKRVMGSNPPSDRRVVSLWTPRATR
jgi:hypothetical protein